MSRAREFADLAGSADAGGLTGRNMLINGQHLITQRGTTFSETTAASYTTDRWLRHVGASFNFDTTITQSTTVPAGTGLTHSLKVEADAAVTPSGSDNAGIGQRIEGDIVKRLAYGAATGKSATLSFWVRSNKTGTYCVMFGMNNGSGTSSEKYLHVKEYTISSADTWEHKTILLPANTTQAITTSTSEGFRIIWWLAVGSSDHVSADSWIQSDSYSATSNQVNFMDSASNEWYLTGCQFELGDNATPFEHRSRQDEYTRCLRYLYRIESNAAYTAFAVTRNWSTTNAGCPFPMPVPMRISPALTTTSISGNFDYSVSAISVAGAQPEAGASGMGVPVVNLDLVGSFTNGGAAQLAAANTTSEVFVQFDAEL